MSRACSITIPIDIYEQLERHLFPGDGDEHGAVVAAGLAETSRGIRLLARSLHLARDGVEYVPGRHGYRMLTGAFVTDCIRECRDEHLVYLAVHSHGGTDAVAFSTDDLASHERGYPALLDIASGVPVGALVFARSAVAGDIWFPGGHRQPLVGARVIGPRWHWLTPQPPPRPRRAGPMYDRQSRIFGDHGQAILRSLKVGIIGAGGVGSVLVELLARLGVGHLVVADPDRVDISNLPRLLGATGWDAMTWLTADCRPRVAPPPWSAARLAEGRPRQADCPEGKPAHPVRADLRRLSPP